MQPSPLTVVLATVVFLAVLVWRVRPAFGPPLFGPRRKAAREALRDARARIEAAGDDPSRAAALCDAAHVMATDLGRRGSATGLYLRAMRADPSSIEIVKRAASGLAKRPRALESLLWRHLGLAPWVEDGGNPKEAAQEALDLLRNLYEGPLNNPARARALAHALESLRSRSPGRPQDGR